MGSLNFSGTGLSLYSNKKKNRMVQGSQNDVVGRGGSGLWHQHVINRATSQQSKASSIEQRVPP